MTFTYTKAFLLWMCIFPFLFVFNAAKAIVDFSLWVFDLPTNVWAFCIMLSKDRQHGVTKDGDKV